MKPRVTPLPPGLYFVATPIGAARDITLRALDILASADILVAEDTRTLRHLLDIHGIPLAGRKPVAYHDHSGPAVRERILTELAGGRSVACVSEAGTPLVADPGYDLSRAVVAAGLPVFAAPGPSAVLAALAVSGLPTDRFLFAGFPPATAAARRRWLGELAGIGATVVLYESPRRVRQTLADMVQAFGKERRAAVARELTKKFEEVCRGTLGELSSSFATREPRGEFVLVVDRAEAGQGAREDMEGALRAALKDNSVKSAVAEVAKALGLPRREVYAAALKLGARE